MVGARRLQLRRADAAGQALFFEAEPNLIACGVR
jgi:hypothetical protein